MAEGGEELPHNFVAAQQPARITADDEVSSDDSETSTQKEEQGQSREQPLDSLRKVFCEIHPSEEVKFFCNKDDCMVCGDCIIEGHHGHARDCVRIDKVAEREKAKLTQAFKDMNTMKTDNISAMIKDIEMKQNSNQNLQRTIADTIDKRSDELVAEIRAKQQELKRQNEIICKQTDDKLERIKRNINKKTRELAAIKDQETSVLGSLYAANFVTVRKQIDSCIQEIKLAEDTCALLPVQVSHFVPGKIDKENVIKDLVGCITPSELNIKTIGTFKSKYPVISICTVSDNSAWFKFPGENFISLTNNKGKEQKTVKFDVLPSYIDKLPNGDILISSFEGQWIKKMSQDGSTVTDLTTSPLHPFGLCVTHDGDILVSMVDTSDFNITSQSMRCVVRMTSSGQTIQTIEYDEDNARLFTLPYRVSENPVTKDICVVDATGEYSGHLCILDSKGNMKTKYTGHQSGVQFNPWDVVCDNRGQIIVCDSSNHKVHLLDSARQFLCYLLNYKDGLEKPTSLALDLTGHLWTGTSSGKVFITKYLD